MARVTNVGEKTMTAEVSLRRPTPVRELVEVSALGHPKVAVAWKDGKLTLPNADYGLMQSRVYIAPRAEIARSALDWFQAQSRIWRALPPLPPLVKPAVLSVPEDVIPAAEGWSLAVGDVDVTWTEPGFAAAAWKPVKLGTFTALGIPDESLARFRKEIIIPPSWKGRSVFLDFIADWSWGVVPQGRLWIDGQPAGVRQPLTASGDSSFSLEVTEQAKDGKITLALEVDGRLKEPAKPRPRPAGTTGIFLLRSEASPVSTTPLAGPWFAARDVGVLTPVKAGEKATYTYLETKFTLPKEWPARRVFLGSPVKLQWIILNNQVIQASMKSLDISGLLRRDGENVLRWIPDYPNVPDIAAVQNRTVPELNLIWKN
ncbi:MAG: hypothetical protein WC637_10780 [Victivallales bacterium]